MTKDTAICAAPARAGAARTRPGPLTFYRVFWLFALASFLGDVVETVFWLVTRGELISRSSLFYGQFSLVWGLGAVLLTVVFHGLSDQGPGPIFLLGTVLGGGYEYICSWFQEAAFGACFWDYRHLPFNLNGRVNLIFCLFWGIVAVIWVRWVYPALSRFIDSIPRKAGCWAARGLGIFLALSTVVSAAALCRMNERHEGEPPSNKAEIYLDKKFPDSRIHARFPNMGVLDEIGWYEQ